MEEWIKVLVKCDICTHQWREGHSIYTIKLKCPNCNNITYFEYV